MSTAHYLRAVAGAARPARFPCAYGVVLPAIAALVLLPLALRAAPPPEEEGPGFRPIFDGEDLEGWDGDPRFWSVEDGAITGRTTPDRRLERNTFLIWRLGPVDDFELRLSYRIVGGNSGIQYRSRDRGDHVVGGYQADIDSGTTYSGILYEEGGRAILAERGQKVRIGPDGEREVTGSLGSADELQEVIRDEEWNEYRIVARGETLIHEINGQRMVEVVDAERERRAEQGVLALQLHAGPPMTVQFKDIRLRRLPLQDDRKKVVFVAGRRSHGKGSHEHNAGCLLLAGCLDEREDILATTYVNRQPEDDTVFHGDGWPRDPTIFDNADSVVFFCDGGGGHPLTGHLEEFDRVMDRGVGFACLHYAVEVPKGDAGEKFLEWLGGYFEVWWSVNPHWTLKEGMLAADHPITRGVETPFTIRDEWYYHMRFREGMEGVTPILSKLPPRESLDRPDGAHSGNEHVREAVLEREEPQHVAWAYERPGGGRGFGFTGGHFHENWGHPGFRELVLNALAWTAGAEVPRTGIECEVSEEDLTGKLDADYRRRLEERRREAEAREDDGGREEAAAPRAEGTKEFASEPVRDRGASVEVAVDLRDAEGLWLVVDDAGDGMNCDWADWVEPRLEGPGGELRLTELDWKGASAGWGRVREDRNAGGRPLRVGGKRVAWGIGTHAPSVIRYEIPEGYTRFRARGALDDGGADQGCGNSVRFLVYTEEPPETVLEAARRSRSRGGSGPLPPQESLARLETGEGLEATLFASEPMVVNPTNIDIDARGRVWVLEGVNYRRWRDLREDGDRIRILEDTDGDGKADEAKTFYQGRDIDSALGICVLGERVIVSRSPQVLVFTDEDGDDRPDRKQVLYSGIGGEQHDHGVHAFVFGPDGRLYFNMGNAGRRLRDAGGEPIVDVRGNRVEANGRPYRQGMALRCAPDGSAVEVIGHNFRNNYELAVDSFGTVWQSDNDDDGNRGVRINYVMEGGNFGYRDEASGAGWRKERVGMHEEVPSRHWHQNDPGVVPNLLQTGAGSPTGICVYEGSLLPERFHGEVIHCDAGPNVVRAYPAERSGAGYEASVEPVLHTPRDRWFRPADVCVAADGSLFVADWYDAGVGGHGMADNQPGSIRGRIYRVAPEGHERVVPPLDVSTPGGAARALRSPNHARRYHGWTALRSFGTGAEGALREMWRSDRPRHRARALHLLARLPESGDTWIREGLADGHADIRIAAIRIARQLRDDVAAVLDEVVHDPVPAVRREVALALRDVEDDDRAARLWAELALRHEAGDRWYLEALGIGARGREDACFRAWRKRAGDRWNTPAGRDIVWRSRATKTPGLLAEILLSEEVPPAEQPRYLRAFDFQEPGPERREALVSLLGSSDDLVSAEALKRLEGFDPGENPAHEELVRRLLDEARGTPRFVALARRLDVPVDTSALVDVAERHAGRSGGAAAVRLLLDRGRAGTLRAVLAGDDPGRALRIATALGNANDGRAVPILRDVVTADGRDPRLIGQCVRSLVRTRSGAGTVVRLAAEGELPPAARSVAGVALAAVPWADLRERAEDVLPRPATREGEPLPPVAELVERRGDAARGHEVWKENCSPCHVVGDEGRDLGPDLSVIGDKLGKDALYQAVLDPNAGISFDYEGTAVVTRTGDEVVGIVVSETEDELTLKTQGGILTTFEKPGIAARDELDLSIMPAGLQQAMTVQDLVDLVEFLSGCRKGGSEG